MSKRSILLSSRDRRELLLCCLLGIGAVLLVDLLMSLSLLLLRQPQILTLPMVGLVLGLSVGLGVLLGLLVFLRRELLQPINTLLTALPRRLNQRQTLPWASLELDAGIAPLQLLAYRINRLLESLRSTSESRQQRLDGLAHDIRGPLTRLLHRIERLEAQGALTHRWSPDCRPTCRPCSISIGNSMPSPSARRCPRNGSGSSSMVFVASWPRAMALARFR